MPRTARAAVGGLVYHVLNRGNGRMTIFRKTEDYSAFVGLLMQAKKHADVEVLGFCLMSNHWHLVVRPRRAGDLALFMSWLTNTHVKRYRAHYSRTSGHLYQGRYKSFPVEEDFHLLTLLRYVEANPLRAGMVRRAENWRWSSAGCGQKVTAKLLSTWPLQRPVDWLQLVNEPLNEPEQTKVNSSLKRGRPLGSDGWTSKIAAKLGLTYTINPRGRPKRKEKR
jgi:putative transposase